MKPMDIAIFTDGACEGNPGPGAAACVIRASIGGRVHERRLVWYDPQTTNQKMELLAAILGLEALQGTGHDVLITTDSQYVAKGLVEWMPNWKRNNWTKQVVNRELWQRLDRAAGLHRVRTRWVKGHNGHPENTLCDKLARQAVRTATSQGMVLDERTRNEEVPG